MFYFKPLCQCDKNIKSDSFRFKALFQIKFTLIELLLIVAILSIMMSLLLPALKKSKETAKFIKCLSNFRQLGVVNQSYISDYNGTVYQYWNENEELRWYQKLAQVGYLKKDFWLKPDHILFCPVGTFGYWMESHGWYMSTGINVESSEIKLYQLRRPSIYIIHGDSHGYNFKSSRWDRCLPGETGTDGLAWVHPNDSATLLFADGHADKISYADALSSWGPSSTLTDFGRKTFSFKYNNQ